MLISEDVLSRNQLEVDGTEPPDVSFIPVRSVLQYFGRHHQRCAALALGRIVVVKEPGEAEISYFDDKFTCYQVHGRDGTFILVALLGKVEE